MLLVPTMRKILTLMLLLLLPLWACAQKVSNVAFEQVGDQVRITYRLDLPTDIQVFLSTDGGTTYGQPLTALTGDAGKNISAGEKIVLWSPLDEMDQLIGDDIVFKVVPAKRSTLKGVLSGRFSVSSSRQVQFSQGNLQYRASTKTWRFAEHQWDYVGDRANGTVFVESTKSNNGQIGSKYGGWIDLFGWGTGNQPFKFGLNDTDYAAFVDWASNPITNGGNMPNQWRTLSKDEWGYLIKKRSNAKSRYGVAAVNGISGLVILPDDWTLPAGCDFTSGSKSVNVWTGSSKNNYTADQWAAMEEAGAVFLPASGCRNGITVENIGTAGSYWSSSSMMGNGAYALYLYMGILYPQYLSPRNIGGAVRLVTDIKVSR